MTDGRPDDEKRVTYGVITTFGSHAVIYISVQNCVGLTNNGLEPHTIQITTIFTARTKILVRGRWRGVHRLENTNFNSLPRNLEHIFIYTYFIYSVRYFVVWMHTFLILERRLTTFLWLSLLWIHVKTQPFVVMWVRFKKRNVDVFAIRIYSKRYIH